MKSKLYRVLVMLLAIAMMIPSFAMAEAPATPTLTLVGPEKPIEVIYNSELEEIDTTGVTWKVENLPTGAELQNAKILWSVTTDNNNGKFSIPESDKEKDVTVVREGSAPKVTLDRFSVNKVDATSVTATITGKLVVNSKEIVSKSFTAKVSKVDVTSIDFTEAAKKKYTTFSAGGPVVSFNPAADIDLKTPEGGASFSTNDVVFSVISGGKYAKITSAGDLKIAEDTPNDTKIKVRAYIPGSKNAGYDASKAEIELNVVGKYKPDEQADPAKDTYTFVGFTVDKSSGNVYTVKLGEDFTAGNQPSFSFNSYLIALGNYDGSDKLVWRIEEDGDKASLNTTTGRNNVLTFNSDTVEANVKVTVASQKDPSVTDSCYVHFDPEEKSETEDEGFTTFKFSPYTEVTITEEQYKNKYFRLAEYLLTEKADDSNDKVFWTNDKNLDCASGWFAPGTLKVEYSPVTVTATSKVKGKTETLKINIIKELPVDDSYTKVEFEPATATAASKTFDIKDYLTLEGPGKASNLIFTSGDPTIAEVDDPYIVDNKLVTLYVNFTNKVKDGDTVTIFVRDGRSSVVMTKLEITYVENEEPQESYKVGFVEKSIPVSLSMGTIDLKDYVYIQDKDGNKISDAGVINRVLNGLIWVSENRDKADKTDDQGVFSLIEKGDATISIRTDLGVVDVKDSTITLNITDIVDEIKSYKIGFVKDPIDVSLFLGDIDLKDYVYIQDKDGKKLPADKAEEVRNHLIWISADTETAEMDEDEKGIVNLYKKGNVKISIRTDFSEKELASTTLNITETPVEQKVYKIGFVQDPIPVSLFAGSINLNDYVFVQDKDGKKIAEDEAKAVLDSMIWVSADTETAEMDEDVKGLFNLYKKGNVKISIRTDHGEKELASTTLKITETPVEDKEYKVGFVQEIIPVSVYGYVPLKDYVFVQDKDGKKIDEAEAQAVLDTLVWISSDTTKAVVNDGNIVPINVGKPTISIRSSYAVKELRSVTLDITKTLDERKDYKVGFVTDSIAVAHDPWGDDDINTIVNLKDYVFVQDKDGNKINGDEAELVIDTLVWVSQNQDKAIVDQDGNVTTRDIGDATISIRSDYAVKELNSINLKISYPAENEAYKIGFVKDAIDVVMTPDNVDLSKYVYVLDKDGNPVDPNTAADVVDSLIWTSENANRAKVDQNGSVELIDEGEATISIRTDYSVEILGSIKLNIKKATKKDLIKVIKFSTDKEVEVAEDGEIDAFDYLVFTDIYGNIMDVDDELKEAIRNEVIWTSEPATVADVEDGKVEAHKVGTATISVRYNVGAEEQVASLKVKVTKRPQDTFTKVKFAKPTEMTVTIDGGHMIFDAAKYLALEGDGNELDLIWTIGGDPIAKVSNAEEDDEGEFEAGGKVTFNELAKNGGTVKITVRYDKVDPALTDTLTLTVKYDQKPYTDLQFTEKELTVSDWSVDLNNYLTTKGNEYDEDELIWTSSNQQIAKIPGNDGIVETYEEGEVTITARSALDPTKTASIKLTVAEMVVPITKITLTQETFDMHPNDTVYLRRYVVTEPEIHPGDWLIFTSDDISIATTAEGEDYIKLKSDVDTVHITVRTYRGKVEPKQFTFNVKARELNSMKFVNAPKNLDDIWYPVFPDDVDLDNIDWDDIDWDQVKLRMSDYLVTDPVDYYGELRWTSSDPQIATVDDEGQVSFRKPGTVTITVTDVNSGKTATHEVTMRVKYPVKSIELKDITLKVGESVYMDDGFMTVMPLKANPDYEKFHWTSSNRDVAEVQEYDDNNRRSTGFCVKAYKAGKTTITANYEREDGTFIKAKCTVTVKDVKLEDVKFAESKYTLKLNSKLNAVVRFNIEPFNCSYEKNDIYFVSSRSDIVSVENYNVDKNDAHKGYVNITAKAPGTAWVTVKRASNDKVLDACKVVVKAVKVKSVKWEKKSVKLYWYNDGITPFYDGTKSNTVYKNFIEVKPIINPENAYCKVSFETTDPGVAFVDNDSVKGFQNAVSTGSSLSDVKILAVGPGACKIIMKVDDGKKVRKATLNVEVETKRPKLKISQRTATLKLEKGKDTLQLRAYDANTDTDLEVKWTSSNTKVAKVNTDGKVRAVGAGTATITATTKEGQKLTVKCKVTVKAPSTENVAAKKITGDTKVTVKAGEKKALEIKVKPEGAKVTFTSSDSKIVKVTKDGKIKGIKAGKATITVKAAEGKAELKIKVTVK